MLEYMMNHGSNACSMSCLCAYNYSNNCVQNTVTKLSTLVTSVVYREELIRLQF
jgi:hypothetical protein